MLRMYLEPKTIGKGTKKCDKNYMPTWQVIKEEIEQMQPPLFAI